MRADLFESLEARVHLAVLADATALLAGVRGNATQYADFNGDGVVDAIGRVADGWTVDLGRPDGTFTPASSRPAIGLPRSTFAERISLGRWTPGDDTIDIAIIRNINRQWSVRLFSNRGDGTFAARPAQPITGDNLTVNRSTVGEVRGGDGSSSDLLWSYSNRLRALRFDASGTIVADSVISMGVQHWSHADFDLDGVDELLLARSLDGASGPTTVQIARRGDADTWTFTTLIEGFDAERRPFAGDLDGDDRPDVAWARGRNVTILRNTTQPADTAITFAPPAAFITIHPDSPPDPGFFTDADRSIIIDAGRFDDGQPPAVIVQTYTSIFGRIPSESVSNHLLRPMGGDLDRTWSVVTLSGASGYSGEVDRFNAERFIDIAGDRLSDLVLGRSARRNILESDVQRPVIGRLAVDRIDPQLGVRTLVASDFTDPDGSVVTVRFYHDSNGDGQWSNDDYALPGRVTTAADGAWRVRLGVDHEYGGPGPTRFFARAWDNQGFVGTPRSFDFNIPGVSAPAPATPGEVPDTTPRERIQVSTTSTALPLATADFTGDGRPDILRLYQGPRRNHRLVLLVGLQPPSNRPDEVRFAAPRIIAEDDVVHGLDTGRTVVGRFTSGSELDIAVMRYRRDSLYEMVLLINDGRGNFSPAAEKTINRYFMLATPHSPEGADQPQSLLAARWNGGIVALRFDDEGRVRDERIVATGGNSPALIRGTGAASIQAADFDGDGRDELVIARSYAGDSRVTFQLLTPRVRGGYRISPITTVITPWHSSFRLGDVDGDGTPDLVVVGSTYTNNLGTAAEMWAQVHRLSSQSGRVRVTEAREIFRERFESPESPDVGISILGIGDATGDAVPDVTVELLTATFDSAHVRAVVIEQPWSTTGQAPRPRSVLRDGQPSGTYIWINALFRMADADGDGVLDLFRRDQTLELYRGL